MIKLRQSLMEQQRKREKLLQIIYNNLCLLFKESEYIYISGNINELSNEVTLEYLDSVWDEIKDLFIYDKGYAGNFLHSIIMTFRLYENQFDEKEFNSLIGEITDEYSKYVDDF